MTSSLFPTWRGFYLGGTGESQDVSLFKALLVILIATRVKNQSSIQAFPVTEE